MSDFDYFISSLVNDISIKQLNQLHQYYQLLKEYNEKMNLTTIISEKEVYIKHFYDSLLLGDVINLNEKSLLDIGTGAGFPGLVIAICYENTKVVLVEPTKKRCSFLEVVVQKLELKNVVIINERAEKLNSKYREIFDIVTARAVANLSILLELLTPFCKVDGKVICLKGDNYKLEYVNANNAIKKLSLKLVKISNYSLPDLCGQRNIIVFNKDKRTLDIFPRDYAKIKNKPL